MGSGLLWKFWAWESDYGEADCKLCDRRCSLGVLCIRTLLAPANQRKLSFDVIKDIPKPLYPDFAREAFRLRNLSLLQALVNNWPHSTFSLSSLLQTVCTNCRSGILPHAEDGKDRLDTHAWKALLDAYFSIVKDYTENSAYPNVCPPLTVFDLSGDSVNGFMSEIEFRGLCKKVLQVLDTCILARTHLSTSAPVNVKPVEIPRFVVIVDASLSELSCDILSWLLHRYEEFPVGLCPVSIQVRRLRITMHDESKLQALLPLLPTDVVGLAFNHIHASHSLATIAEYLTAFLQVKYLDLGFCPFVHFEEPSIRDTFANSLSQLPHLIRLNLNWNRLERCLYILDNICQGLEFFLALHCYLVTGDLFYLAHSKHSQSLKTLSLSGNDLSEHFPAFRTLLMATPQLEVLDVGFIDFDDQQMLALVDTLVGGDNLNVLYSSLRKLYIGCHGLRCDTIMLLLERLSSLPKVERLVLGGPDDLETLNLEGDAGLETFFKMCTDAWRKTDPVKPELKLVWCL